MNEVIHAIKSLNNTIYISGHKRADCDSLCSSISLALILNDIGKNCKVYVENCDIEKIDYFNCSDIIVNKIEDSFFTLISVDLNNNDRLPSDIKEVFEKANKTINIDHHLKNVTCADYICSLEDKSSTCEIVYEMSKKLNVPISKKVAELLFTGIVSDTNMLVDNASYQTFLIISELIKKDINKDFLINKYVISKTKDEMKIIAYMINNLIFDKIHYVILDINKEPFKNVSYINISKKCIPVIMCNEDIKLLLVIMNYGNKIKGEIRSRGNINSEKLANLLNGGGHFNASSFSCKKDLSSIIDISKKYMEKIK